MAHDQHILDRFVRALGVCGVVGEDRNAKIIFLALTSRLLDDPVSVAIKGVSSSGKSHTTETTLRFFPPAAYVEMTAMSERAIVYSKEDYVHRMIVLFEAVALREQREKTESNLTAYFVRSLLSEGRIRYPVTVRDKDGSFTTKTIEDRRGRPGRYVIGEPMPDEVVLLPHICTPPEDETAGQDGVCSSAATAEGKEGGAMSKCELCDWSHENAYSKQSAVHALQTHMRKHRSDDLRQQKLIAEYTEQMERRKEEQSPDA